MEGKYWAFWYAPLGCVERYIRTYYYYLPSVKCLAVIHTYWDNFLMKTNTRNKGKKFYKTVGVVHVSSKMVINDVMCNPSIYSFTIISWNICFFPRVVNDKNSFTFKSLVKAQLFRSPFLVVAVYFKFLTLLVHFF